jgi:hypothetical protein
MQLPPCPPRRRARQLLHQQLLLVRLYLCMWLKLPR